MAMAARFGGCGGGRVRCAKRRNWTVDCDDHGGSRSCAARRSHPATSDAAQTAERCRRCWCRWLLRRRWWGRRLKRLRRFRMRRRRRRRMWRRMRRRLRGLTTRQASPFPDTPGKARCYGVPEASMPSASCAAAVPGFGRSWSFATSSCTCASFRAGMRPISAA
jgi:hypothetical protein